MLRAQLHHIFDADDFLDDVRILRLSAACQPIEDRHALGDVFAEQALPHHLLQEQRIVRMHRRQH